MRNTAVILLAALVTSTGVRAEERCRFHAGARPEGGIPASPEPCRLMRKLPWQPIALLLPAESVQRVRRASYQVNSVQASAVPQSLPSTEPKKDPSNTNVESERLPAPKPKDLPRVEIRNMKRNRPHTGPTPGDRGGSESDACPGPAGNVAGVGAVRPSGAVSESAGRLRRSGNRRGRPGRQPGNPGFGAFRPRWQAATVAGCCRRAAAAGDRSPGGSAVAGRQCRTA